jgi:hypothetical protein
MYKILKKTKMIGNFERGEKVSIDQLSNDLKKYIPVAIHLKYIEESTLNDVVLEIKEEKKPK